MKTTKILTIILVTTLLSAECSKTKSRSNDRDQQNDTTGDSGDTSNPQSDEEPIPVEPVQIEDTRDDDEITDDANGIDNNHTSGTDNNGIDNNRSEEMIDSSHHKNPIELLKNANLTNLEEIIEDSDLRVLANEYINCIKKQRNGTILPLKIACVAGLADALIEEIKNKEKITYSEENREAFELQTIRDKRVEELSTHLERIMRLAYQESLNGNDTKASQEEIINNNILGLIKELKTTL
jgi:hypothetical protein